MGRTKKVSTKTDEGKPPFQAPALRADMRRRAHHPLYVVAPYGEKTGFPEPYHLTPEGIEQVRTWAEAGVTIGSIANGLGIDPKTFLAIRERQPEVQAAIDAGRADYNTRIADMLMKHTEEGNVTTLIFLAKTRAGFVEQSGEVEGASPKTVNNTQININMPPAMTKEQFAELMAQTTQPLKAIDITPTKAKVLK